MKRKQQFLRAIQIMAPNDPLVFQAAQRVSEEALPVAPGGEALEFVEQTEVSPFASNAAWTTHSALTSEAGAKLTCQRLRSPELIFRTPALASEERGPSFARDQSRHSLPFKTRPGV
jgi:hypothetical protein